MPSGRVSTTGRHRTDRARRSSARRALLVGVLVVLVAGLTTVIVVVSGRGDDGNASSGGRTGGAGETVPEGPQPHADIMVIPVDPVGGDTARGKQTLEGAQQAVDAAADYGAVGVRVTADLNWLCSSARTACDTSPLEPVVQRARDRGLQVYLHVNSTPDWLDPRGRWYGPTGDDAEEWAGLFAQLVSRFGTDIAGYEVWNEPNNPEFWQPEPDAGGYADLLKAVWTAAKAVNPDIVLIGGVLSNNDLGYMSRLDRALAARGGTTANSFFYDVLGVHPYAGRQGEGYTPDRKAGTADQHTDLGVKDMTFRGLERLRAQVAQDEGIQRDVVIGEFGYDTTPGAWYHVAEPTRATYLAAALRIAAGWTWVKAFSVYDYSDDPHDGFSVLGTPSEAALHEETQALRN
jgi:hypothetical protein